MKIVPLLLLLLVPLTSESATNLTIAQALDLARHHSFALKKAAASTEAASALNSASNAERWPTLALTGNAFYIDDVPTIQLGPTSRPFGSKETYQADVRLNLPLFTGGRISSGIDLSRAGRDLEQALAKGDSDRVALVTWTEYLGLQRADQMVQAAQASLKRAEIITSDVNSLFSAGVADSIDLNESRLALTRSQLGVTQAMIQRRLAEIRLAIVVGFDFSEAISAESTVPDPDTAALTSVPRVWSTKSELKAAQAGIAINKARAQLTVADFFPTVSALGGYSYGKPNQDRFNNIWNDYWTVGANLNWSFNLGGRASARRKAARFDLMSAETEQDRVAEAVKRDARLATEQVRLMYAKYQSSREEFQIASDQFRLARDRYANGDLSSNRLLDIETSLTAAQSALAVSLADYWLATAAWYYSLGSDRLQEGY